MLCIQAVGEGDEVKVVYSAHLVTQRKVGALVESNRGTESQLRVTVGSAPEGNVPQGIHDALIEMNNKGKRIVAIPSRLGFGSRGGSDGRIPANADLVYQIEVVAVRVKKSAVAEPEEVSVSDSEASESVSVNLQKLRGSGNSSWLVIRRSARAP